MVVPTLQLHALIKWLIKAFRNKIKKSVTQIVRPADGHRNVRVVFGAQAQMASFLMLNNGSWRLSLCFTWSCPRGWGGGIWFKGVCVFCFLHKHRVFLGQYLFQFWLLFKMRLDHTCQMPHTTQCGTTVLIISSSSNSSCSPSPYVCVEGGCPCWYILV